MLCSVTLATWALLRSRQRETSEGPTLLMQVGMLFPRRRLGVYWG